MRAVICGAGIAGLALANRLCTAGWDVVVLERSPGPRTQGYMIDFFGTGYDAAEAMGIAPRLHELGYHVHEAAFVGADGRPRGRLGYDRFADVVGGRLLSIMRPDLELALRESLPAEVRIRYGTGPVRIDDTGTDGVRVTLRDGETLTADLLVGADGIHSAVRAMVFGPERDYLRHLGFHTAAFSFTDPALHARVRDRFHLTDTIDRQLGLYGLRDDRVAVFAVHRTDDPALPQDPVAALRAEYGSLGWVVPDALAQCPPAEQLYYDQVAQVVMPSWHRGRVVLVGDACYAVSLLAGQGASLGVAGAFVLADQLHRAPTVASALAGYERLWRPVAEEKQQVARRAVRWFLPRGPVDLWVRRGMLGLSRVPGLNRVIGGALAGKTSTVVTELRRQQNSPTGTAARRG
ncbi:FAD-dependent monooxygenase [Pseudonocardia parietis]|uniref:2-polyprenyl-6-methoxyphenol hydroxylase-like FAD-dependent oxidoreductase n=1 Tax=Pseudonocardia parietis TaxID=570936 RepID=A0ABS4VXU2_9PSEU|nr:FAD-dependent monooxygenase [Pseudonocardia parietis]MBP2368289.1 2-polyprenyl-6-methoxyphenol hydroxylase-like FAD-dependent oxidoreductase [Pseudonocardia parietis]